MPSSPPPRRRKRPRVPEPPNSLVKLIQTDKAVLVYMQALQANLEEDVRIWKERARYYQQQLEEKQQQSDEEQKTKKKKKIAVKTKKKPVQKETITSTSEKEVVEMPPLDPGEVPVDDSMFDLASSSSESEPDDKMDEIVEPRNDAITEPTTFEADILPLLDQALSALEHLGVLLVDEEQVPVVESNDNLPAKGEDDDDDDDGLLAASPTTTTAVFNPVYSRRTDAQVVSDILYQVSAWTRVEDAFDVLKLDPKPILQQGMQLLVRSLVILDTFDDCNHEILASDPAKYTGILGGRKGMVDTLLQTLSAEISEAWAIKERSTRLATLSLHYYADASATNNNTLDMDDEQLTVGTSGNNKHLARRLAPIVRSRLLADLTIGLYLSRNDYETAAQVVFDYIVSTVPTVIEDYPKLPPVFSFIVLEGMLHPTTSLCWWEDPTATENGNVFDGQRSNDWFIQAICSSAVNPGDGADAASVKNYFSRALWRCIERTSLIWKERMLASDPRIHDIARVEWACYQRLRESEVSWLVADQRTAKTVAWTIKLNLPALHKAQLLSYLVVKDMNGIQDLLCKAILSDSVNQLVPLAEAGRQVIMRQIDEYQAYSSLAADPTGLFVSSELFGKSLERVLEQGAGVALDAASRMLKVCELLSDGMMIVKLMEPLLLRTDMFPTRFEDSAQLLDFYKTVSDISDCPCVYIINLKRRTDRRKAIMAQALRERILVTLAVASLDSLVGKVENADSWGSHAFDGMGRMLEAQAPVWAKLGGAKDVIKALINVTWRPNDLKLFDKHAPDDEGLVEMSESEIACALSHIASWHGAKVALQLRLPSLTHAEDNIVALNSIFDYPRHVLRGLRIGGYARGPALLSRNEDMPPAPVVVILEDDAVLVDRFRERLEELLNELPRDFHFCSIGYGRPKTAPIVPFNTQCGVPTHLFYLTGYLLSESGADHLLGSIPVTGPIDSFIGLKMTNNWENTFGEHVGVGIQGKPITSPVAKKDMANILNFRAFCALQPLCSQRVGGKSTSTGRAWRQRDTDIQYSGDRRQVRRRNARKR